MRNGKQKKEDGTYNSVLTHHENRYLAIIAVCASTEIPCPLPVFDLSKRVFASANKKMKMRSEEQNARGEEKGSHVD